MIYTYITPDLAERINNGIKDYFWPNFNKMKNALYDFLIENIINENGSKYIAILIILLLAILFLIVKNWFDKINGQ